MKFKKTLFWVLAILIACGLMIYQRMTGPTYEKKYTFSWQDKEYQFTLPRTHGGKGNCPVELALPDEFKASVIWRKYPTELPWDTLHLKREGKVLVTSLPHQPPAGKLEYHLELKADGQLIDLQEKENVVIRFKGDVPAWALLPHVLMMVLTVIWAMATIFFALANLPAYKKYTGITLIFLIIGGFILGPIVQKFSFGQFWTGWPLGEDLTDNKVLAPLIAYLFAWFLRKKSYARWLSIAASLIMLAVYLIPHSMHGSELDYQSGEVVTGSLSMVFVLFSRLAVSNYSGPHYS